MDVDAALLEAKDARVDVGGAPALDGLAMRVGGARALVLGAARALFEAASGARGVARGAVLVHGEPAASALRAARVAGAPLDPPMPAAWTPRRYVTWSARLAGRDAKLARALAEDAIVRMRIRALAAGPLGKAAPHARRATVIAAAIATGARAVMLEDFTEGLPESAAASLARVTVAALADRAWVLFAPRVALGSPLAGAAESAVVIDGGRVAAQGAPADVASRARAYALTVHGEVDALARAAEARGAKVTRDAARLTVDLGESLTTRELLALALEARAVIVGMAPVARALS